jgi:hypothetical protein
MACVPFSITLAVLATDNKRQFSFSINKGCVEEKPVYVLVFIFRDRNELTEPFQDRVSLQVTVGDTDSPKAEKLIARGMNNAQLAYLKGPLTDIVEDLPPTGGAPSNDPTALNAASQILNSKPVLPS